MSRHPQKEKQQERFRCECTYVCDHAEADQEGDGAAHQDEDLLALASSQEVGVHVDHGRHEALHAHELKQTIS